MSGPAQRLATYEELLRMPEQLVAEIINGRLVTHPRPAPRHLRASLSLGGELDGPCQKGLGGPGGWRILDEPELHLREDEEDLSPVAERSGKRTLTHKECLA